MAADRRRRVGCEEVGIEERDRRPSALGDSGRSVRGGIAARNPRSRPGRDRGLRKGGGKKGEDGSESEPRGKAAAGGTGRAKAMGQGTAAGPSVADPRGAVGGGGRARARCPPRGLGASA